MINLVKKYVLSFAFLSCLSGCTSVYVEGTGKVEKSIYPGVLSINIAPGDGVSRVKTNMIGVRFESNGMDIGLLKEDRVEISKKCVIVILDSNVNDFNEIREILIQSGVSMSAVCLGETEKKQ